MNKKQRLKFKIQKLMSKLNSIRDIETRVGLYLYIRKLQIEYKLN